MSRSFATVPTGYYRVRNFDVLDAKLCVPPVQPSRMIPIDINWADYGAPGTANIGVEIILPSQVSDKLGKIGSVYIDNTGSTVPIYVRFADTQFVITAPPATATWFPVFTNNFQMQVYCLNMTTGFVPTTKLFISNREIGPSVDNEIFNVVPQYLGSASIQRSNLVTPGFGPPALGDQIASLQCTEIVNLSTLPFQQTVLAASSGFYYITGYALRLQYMAAASTGAVAAPGAVIRVLTRLIDITDNSTIENFEQCVFLPTSAGAVNAGVTDINFVSPGTMNLRLTAAHGYGIQWDSSSLSGGAVTGLSWRLKNSVMFAYTNNPQ